MDFAEWQAKFNKLESDYQRFHTYYDRHKKCKCEIDECPHFERALIEVMGDRVDQAFVEKLYIGYKTMKDNFI